MQTLRTWLVIDLPTGVLGLGYACQCLQPMEEGQSPQTTLRHTPQLEELCQLMREGQNAGMTATYKYEDVHYEESTH